MAARVIVWRRLSPRSVVRSVLARSSRRVLVEASTCWNLGILSIPMAIRGRRLFLLLRRSLGVEGWTFRLSSLCLTPRVKLVFRRLRWKLGLSLCVSRLAWARVSRQRSSLSLVSRAGSRMRWSSGVTQRCSGLVRRDRECFDHKSICIPSSTTRPGGSWKYAVAGRAFREMKANRSLRHFIIFEWPVGKSVSRPRK